MTITERRDISVLLTHIAGKMDGSPAGLVKIKGILKDVASCLWDDEVYNGLKQYISDYHNGKLELEATTPKQRVEVELQELTDKSERLFSFLQSDNFINLPEVMQGLLNAQYNTMAAYTSILALRLELWEDTKL